jgi:hypothetical protein
MRDYTVGDTFDIKFTTRAFATGIPTTLAGTPVISAYPDNSTTQLTAGLTLTVDFDAVTGLNNVRVVATGGNGYAAGSSYALVITTGTVGGVSVVGETVGEFTLGRSAAFARLGAPAGASASADIAAVKVDTAAVKTKTDFLPSVTAGAAGGVFIAGSNAATSITTALTANVTGNLSGSVGSVTGAVGSVTGAVGSVTGAVGSVTGNVGGNVVGSVASVTGAVGSVTAGVTLAASAIQAIWDALSTALTTVGSIGKRLVDAIPNAVAGAANGLFIAGTNAATAITTALTTTFTGNLTGSVASVTGAVGSVTGAVGSVATGGIAAASFAAGAIDAAAIATDAIGSAELAASAVTEIQTGLATAAALATVQADTDDIQTRLPAALTGAGNMKSDALAINGNTTAAAVLAILNGVTVVYQGTVTGAATTTTLIDTGLTQADTDWWKGRIILFTSVITLQATDITGFDPATDKLTFTAVTTAPTGATYVII